LHFLSFHAPSTTVIYTLSLHDALPICPCYYYQKQFFSGKDHPLSKPGELMHYDLEVSGFPSSHAGHLVLLGLTDQDYPHCVRIEQWPTWDLPILRWGKSQGALRSEERRVG